MSPSRVMPFLAYFASRLVLININEAEFTDGYQLLTWSFENPVRWHPLYPTLLKPLGWIFQPEIAGRLLSILSGFGAMFILSEIAKKLYDDRTAWIVRWLYVVSPLFFWMNLRVLTESTFQFFFCASLYYFVAWWRNEKAFASPAFLFLSGLACLTRPEGYVFLPLVAYVLYRQFVAKEGLRIIGSIFLALVPWFVSFFWTFAISASDSYSQVMGENIVGFKWQEAFTRLIFYIEVYPYILFYPLFPLALYQLLRGTVEPIWKYLLFYFHIVFALVLFMHPAWSTRFLVLPLSLLVIEVAAAFTVIRRSFRIILLAGCFLFSLFAIFLQKQMFYDFKHAAISVKGRFNESRVISDEQAKTNFYLGKPVIVYDKTEDLRTGDILILHSYNTDLNEEKKVLDARYRYRPLLSTNAEITPLLANAALAHIAYTNSPFAALYRFQRQRFQTVVILIESKL